MKAVVTVIGKDKEGIIAEITSALAENKVNVLEISQTILQNYFTMIMIVDLEKMEKDFNDLKEILEAVGKKIDVSIKIQHEDIFNSMHTV